MTPTICTLIEITYIDDETLPLQINYSINYASSWHDGRMRLEQYLVQF